MNATEIKPVNFLPTDEWIVTVMDEIDALPDSIADHARPEIVGQLDAQLGRECDPLRFYAKLSDIELYCIGWREVMDALGTEADSRHQARVAGKADATEGLPCGTFRHYGNPLDARSYTAGYNSVRALTDAEIEAEADDYEDYQLDCIFNSRGGWL